MQSPDDPETTELLNLADQGDPSAIARLWSRHRDRLRQVIRVRFDPRLSTRIDPSDVIQETLIVASRRLPEYLEHRDLPFFAWLRQLAWERLVELHRQHIGADKRTVVVERNSPEPVNGEWIGQGPGERLVTAESEGPLEKLIRGERRETVQRALSEFPVEDRELLRLRHLEQLTIAEISTLLEVPEGTVKSRHFRLLQQLRIKLIEEGRSDSG